MKNLKKILTLVLLVCALTVLMSVSAWADGRISVPPITGTGEVTAVVYPASDKSIHSSNWRLGGDCGSKLTLTDHANYGSSADAYITSNVNETATYSVFCDLTYTDESTETVAGSVSVTATGPVINGITLNQTAANLFLNDGFQLTATTDPLGYPVSWSSDNNAVAVVNGSGYVTATGKGSTTVRATSGDKSAECSVTVTVPVTGVNLDYYDLELPINQWTQLTATVVPANADNKTVTWSSSDSGKVSVDANGVIRRIADGNVQITVTTADGAKTAVCNVSSPEPTPTLTISEDSINLTNAGRQLKVYCSGSDVTEACDWVSYNTSVATVSKGVVTPVANGTTTVSARYSVGSMDETLYCTVTVSKSTSPLTLSSYTLTLSLGGGNAFLQPYFNGSPIAANTCTWECSDLSVISVNQGTITPLKAGTSYVRVKYNNVYSDVCTVTVNTSSSFFTITNVSNNATFDGVNPLYFVTSAAYDAKAYPTVSIVGANNVYSRNLTYGTDYRIDCSPDGHLMVTVNPTTLHNLPQANFHNIAITYNGQTAYARFWRTGTSYNVYGVRTGDDNNIALWVSICIIGFVGASVIVITKRKDIFSK